MNTLISSNQIKLQNKPMTLYLLILVELQETILLMITDLTVMNKIVKNNKVYSLIMKTTMTTITIMKTPLSKIKMKTVMKQWYIT